jgi:hypothetical protein
MSKKKEQAATGLLWLAGLETCVTKTVAHETSPLSRVWRQVIDNIQMICSDWL